MGIRTRTDANELRRRAETLLAQAGALSLRTAHATFRDEASLIELGSLDARIRLRARRPNVDGDVVLYILDRQLTRLQGQCAYLVQWLESHGLEDEFKR